jgi:hypothetical protein
VQFHVKENIVRMIHQVELHIAENVNFALDNEDENCLRKKVRKLCSSDKL